MGRDPVIDEPTHFSAEEFVNDPDNDFHFKRKAWFHLRQLKVTFAEVDYLLLTDDFVRMGGGRGCWASVEYMSRILDKSRRSIQIIRQTLIKKGLLIPAGEILVRGGPRPVYHTVLRPPDTRGAMVCAPPLRAQTIAPHKEEKTKDKNSKPTPPPAAVGKSAGDPTPSSGKTTMPFIINTKQDLARQLATELLTKFKSSPPEVRERHYIPAKLNKSWVQNMENFIKANWSGGDTAVKLLFDRLFKSWDKLDPKVLPTPTRLFKKSPENRSYYFEKVLLPALDKLDSLSRLPTKAPPHLEQAWFEIKNVKWNGDPADWKLRLECLVRTDAALKSIRDRLVVLGRAGDATAQHLWRCLKETTAVKLVLSVRQFVQKNVPDDGETKFSYLSPKFCLSVPQMDQHGGIKLLLERSIKDVQARAKIVRKVQETK